MKGTNRTATVLERTLRNQGRLGRNERLVEGTPGIEISFEIAGFHKTELPKRSSVARVFEKDTRHQDFEHGIMCTICTIVPVDGEFEVKDFGKGTPDPEFVHTLR